MVPGREGLYEVSNLGRVRSLDRVVLSQNRWGPYLRRLSGRVLRATSRGGGYLSISVADGKGKRTYVHALVLRVFHSERPLGTEACHNNGIRSDNRATNLRWATHVENEADKERHGTRTNRGEKHPLSRLTESSVRSIRNSTESVRSLARKLRVSRTTVENVRKGASWRSVA